MKDKGNVSKLLKIVNFLEEMPDYHNPKTRAAENEMGPYEYDNRVLDKSLILKPPYMFDNGSVYQGTWNKNNQREGRGIQWWKDGSKYTGYWFDDKANGPGRLVHANGDVYQGNWKNDKVQGYGLFKFEDGASYAGEWENDR